MVRDVNKVFRLKQGDTGDMLGEDRMLGGEHEKDGNSGKLAKQKSCFVPCHGQYARGVDLVGSAQRGSRREGSSRCKRPWSLACDARAIHAGKSTSELPNGCVEPVEVHYNSTIA